MDKHNKKVSNKFKDIEIDESVSASSSAESIEEHSVTRKKKFTKHKEDSKIERKIENYKAETNARQEAYENTTRRELDVVNNRIESATSHNLEFRQETRKALEEQKQETKAEMQKLQEANTRLIARNDELAQALIDHQTATANAITAVHNQVNDLGKFVYLLAEQILELQKLVRQGAQKVAEKIKPDDIIAPPKASEIAMLKKALEDFSSDDWHKSWITGIDKLEGRRLDKLLDGAIDCALTSYKIAATTRMLSGHDKASLIDSFLESFTSAPGFDSSNTYLAIGGLLARTAIALAVTGYELRQLHKEKKALDTYWGSVTKDNVKIMIELLKTPTKEYFDKMVEECRHCYDVNYNRRDCSVHNAFESFTGKGASYRRRFEKIPDFIQDCCTGTRITDRIHKAQEAKHDYIFDINVHFKDGITPKERDDFLRRFRLYRAFNGIVEFENRTFCGDITLETDNKHIGRSVYGILSIISVGLVPMVTGISNHYWKKNSTELEKIILNCIIGSSPATLKAIIRRADALARIKTIIETTKSDFIIKSYNECLREMYGCVRPELEYQTLFINAFDVYCRIKNYGEYNHNNYLCCFEKPLTVQEEENSYTRLIESGLKKVSVGLEAIGKDTTQTYEIRKDENGDTVFTTTKVTLPNTTTQLSGVVEGLASGLIVSSKPIQQKTATA